LEKNAVLVHTVVLKEDLKYNEETILTYSIEYPEFRSFYFRKTLVMVNHYYKMKAFEYQKYCRTELFNMAVEQYNDAIKNNFPVRVFEAMVVYKLTYNVACIISLYFDKYEYTGGAHGNTIRYSQTWNLQKGRKIKLRELFGCQLDYRAYIFRLVEEEIEKDPSIYFEDYQKLLVETFNENSFYCTPEGIIIYYQQYDIAPYSSGIREFLIPYTHCVINPIINCN
jgi:hypothetical protein